MVLLDQLAADNVNENPFLANINIDRKSRLRSALAGWQPDEMRPAQRFPKKVPFHHDSIRLTGPLASCSTDDAKTIE